MIAVIRSVPEVLVSNARASAGSCSKPRLTPWSRQLLVQRLLAGRPAAHVPRAIMTEMANIATGAGTVLGRIGALPEPGRVR